MRTVILILGVMAVLLCGCGDDGPTQPIQPTTAQGTLMLNHLTVSVVPLARDTVVVCATKVDGSPCACTVTSSAPGIATATLNDSTLLITGQALGTATITVTSATGKTCVLPVKVYDHKILDAGELLITYTDRFAWVDNTLGWPVYNPIPPAGFVALGAYIVPTHYNPTGREAAMVVKAKPGSNAIVFTRNFETTTAAATGYWYPIAPTGYKAMGTVASFTGVPPDSAPCVRADLTTPGVARDTILCDARLWNYSFWRVGHHYTEPHERAYLSTGAFVLTAGSQPLNSHKVANVLNVELPVLSDASNDNVAPRLTSSNPPANDWTAPVMTKAMLVPCSIVNDPVYSPTPVWQVANSPFYRLERYVYYKYLYHLYNQTTQPQPASWSVTYGITAQETQKIWSETGVELSMGMGISLKGVSGDISATVSKKLGYESLTGISELNSYTTTTPIVVPPGKAAALWQRFNRFILYRHNGSTLEPVKSWDVGMQSYVVDQYPDE